jgi:hypothetical protein
MDCPDAKKAAMVIAQAAAGMIEAIGMEAANRQAAANGHAEPYGEAAFQALVVNQGLDWNTLVTNLVHG